MNRFHEWGLGLVLLAALVAGGCGGDTGDAAAPDRWKRMEAAGLSLAHPPSLSPRPEGERIKPDAAKELVGPEGEQVPPRLFVFVERGPMGTLQMREEILTGMLKAKLNNVSFESQRDLEVPGAAAARVLELTYTTQQSATPARQIEVTIQTEEGPQYAIRYGASEKHWNGKQVQRMVDTLRVERQ